MAGGPLSPFAVYPATAGKVFPNFHIGSTNNRAVEGLGVMASLDANAVWETWFYAPLELPSGSPFLRLLSVANANAGVARINPTWARFPVGTVYDTVTLTAEGVQSVTWASGDADKLKETKIALDASTILAADLIYIQLLFQTISWTLAFVSTWQASIIWE